MTRTLVLKWLWLNLRDMTMVYYDKKTKTFYKTGIMPYTGNYIHQSLHIKITHDEARSLISSALETNKHFLDQKIYVNSNFFNF